MILSHYSLQGKDKARGGQDLLNNDFEILVEEQVKTSYQLLCCSRVTYKVFEEILTLVEIFDIVLVILPQKKIHIFRFFMHDGITVFNCILQEDDLDDSHINQPQDLIEDPVGDPIPPFDAVDVQVQVIRFYLLSMML